MSLSSSRRTTVTVPDTVAHASITLSRYGWYTFASGLLRQAVPAGGIASDGGGGIGTVDAVGSIAPSSSPVVVVERSVLVVVRCPGAACVLAVVSDALLFPEPLAALTKARTSRATTA